jgi:hypothetical protein
MKDGIQKRFHKLLIVGPVLYIVALWFLFSSPYFIRGLVPYPSKYQVTFFPPWSYFQKWWGPVKNNAMPDIVDQIYPWKHFTIKWLKNGQIPYWNPYNFSGNPHVANFQSAVFSPFNLLYFIFPFIDAWSIIVLLQPLLAGIFTFTYLREFKVSKSGSLIGSISFMFCGFMVVWMAYGTLSMSIAFLPLALFGIEKGIKTKNICYFLLITFSLILSIFSGHIQTSLYLSLFIACYVIFSLLFNQAKRFVFYAFLFYLTGIAVSMLQIYPTFILYGQSVRSSLLYQGGGIPWYYLVTLFAPDFYGNPVTRNDWFGTYAEWSSFTGIIPLFLAFIGLIYNKNKHVLFFGLSAIITLLLAMDSPLHFWLLATRIPILATSIPSRIIVLFSFSIAVLSSFGYDRLIIMLNTGKYRKIFPIVAVLLVLLFLICFSLLFFQILPVDKAMLAQRNMFLPMFFLGMLSVLLLIHKSLKIKKLTVIISIIILSIVSFDSFRFAAKWIPFDPKGFVYPKLSIIDAIQKNIGLGRIYGNIGAEVSSYYGISSIEGYDPLYIGRYGELLQYASDGIFKNATRSVAHLDRRGKYTDRVLDLLGVTVIYHPLADTNTTWAYPVWQNYKKYSVIYQDDKFQLYRNNSALPRVKLYYNYEVITENHQILARLLSDTFDINQQLILEKELKGMIVKIYNPVNQGITDILSYTPNKVVIKVKTQSNALLFLSDNYYPNWKAYINGQETPIYRADYTFRAIVVPEGESVVTYVYSAYF